MTTLSSLFFAFALQAAVVDFKDVGDANAYIFKNFTGLNNDSQGALVVAGDVVLSGYTVATLNKYDQLALATNGNLEVVGGDVNGFVSVAGTSTISNTNDLRLGMSDFSFDQKHFQELSENLSKQNNASNTVKWRELFIDTSFSSNTYITNIDSDDLFDFSSVKTGDLSLGARIIINISGKDIDLTSKDWLIKTSSYEAHDEANILFNFFEADTLTISTSLYGSVLAPNADVFGNGGMINGQLIANSFTTGTNGGGTQLNQSLFNSDIPLEIDKVEELPNPGLYALFLGSLVVLLRKRIIKR